MTVAGTSRPRQISIRHETWPTRGVWRIAHGSLSAVDVVVVEIRAGTAVGRGECRPYARYGESVTSVIALIEGVRTELEAGLERATLQQRLPAGAARNAIDCALWDLAAKQTRRPVWQLAGLSAPQPLITAYTLAIDTPAALAGAARGQAQRPLIKLKLAGDGEDLARVEAVHANAPECALIVDANEAWQPADYRALAPAFAELGVALIEQPFAAEADQSLAELARPVPVCADESCHDCTSLPALAGRYDLVNIKLDKTGGLTEALALRQAASAAGFGIMVGCMVGTSLAMAPALLLAQGARYVDLDGPLQLARDRESGLAFQASRIEPPLPALWG